MCDPTAGLPEHLAARLSWGAKKHQQQEKHHHHQQKQQQPFSPRADRHGQPSQAAAAAAAAGDEPPLASHRAHSSGSAITKSPIMRPPSSSRHAASPSNSRGHQHQHQHQDHHRGDTLRRHSSTPPSTSKRRASSSPVRSPRSARSVRRALHTDSEPKQPPPPRRQQQQQQHTGSSADTRDASSYNSRQRGSGGGGTASGADTHCRADHRHGGSDGNPTQQQQQQQQQQGGSTGGGARMSAAEAKQLQAEVRGLVSGIRARRAPLFGAQLRYMTFSRLLAGPDEWSRVCKAVALDSDLLDGPLVAAAARNDTQERAATSRLAAAVAGPIDPDAPSLLLPAPGSEQEQAARALLGSLMQQLNGPGRAASGGGAPHVHAYSLLRGDDEQADGLQPLLLTAAEHSAMQRITCAHV